MEIWMERTGNVAQRVARVQVVGVCPGASPACSAKKGPNNNIPPALLLLPKLPSISHGPVCPCKLLRAALGSFWWPQIHHCRCLAAMLGSGFC